MSIKTFYSTVLDFGLDFDLDQVKFVWEFNGKCDELALEMLLINDKPSIDAMMVAEGYRSKSNPKAGNQPKAEMFQELGAKKKKSQSKKQPQQPQQSQHQNQQPQPNPNDQQSSTQQPVTTAPAWLDNTTTANQHGVAHPSSDQPSTTQPSSTQQQHISSTTTLSSAPADPAQPQPATNQSTPQDQPPQPTSQSTSLPTQPPFSSSSAWANRLQIKPSQPPTSQLSLRTTSTDTATDSLATKDRDISTMLSNHNKHASETARLNSIYADGIAPQLTPPPAPKPSSNTTSLHPNNLSPNTPSTPLSPPPKVNPITRTDYGYTPSYINAGSTLSSTYPSFSATPAVIDASTARQEQYVTEKLNMCLSIQELLQEQGEFLDLDVILAFFDQLCAYYYETDVIDHQAEHKLLTSTPIHQSSRDAVINAITRSQDVHTSFNSSSRPTGTYLSSDPHFHNMMMQTESQWTSSKQSKSGQRGGSSYKMDYQSPPSTSQPKYLSSQSPRRYGHMDSATDVRLDGEKYVKERKIINGLTQNAKKVMSYYNTFLKHSANSSNHSRNSRSSHSSTHSGGNQPNYLFLDNISTHSRDSRGSKGSKGSKKSKSSRNEQIDENSHESLISAPKTGTATPDRRESGGSERVGVVDDQFGQLLYQGSPCVESRSVVHETAFSPPYTDFTDIDGGSQVEVKAIDAILIPPLTQHRTASVIASTPAAKSPTAPTTPGQPATKTKNTPGKGKSDKPTGGTPAKKQQLSLDAFLLLDTPTAKQRQSKSGHFNHGDSFQDDHNDQGCEDGEYGLDDGDEWLEGDEMSTMTGVNKPKHGINKFLQRNKQDKGTDKHTRAWGESATPSTTTSSTQPAQTQSTRRNSQTTSQALIPTTRQIPDNQYYSDGEFDEDFDEDSCEYDEDGNPILFDDNHQISSDLDQTTDTEMLEYDDAYFLGKGSMNKQNRYKKKDKQFVLKKSKREKFAPAGSLATTPLATHGSAGSPAAPVTKSKMFTIADKDRKGDKERINDSTQSSSSVKTIVAGGSEVKRGNDCIMMLMDEIVNTPHGNKRYAGKIMFPLQEFFEFTLEQLQTIKYEELMQRKLKEEQAECDPQSVARTLLRHHHYEYAFVDLFSSLSNDLTQGILGYLNPVEIHIALEFLDEQQLECDEIQTRIEKAQHRYTEQCLKAKFGEGDAKDTKTPATAHPSDKPAPYMVAKEREDLIARINDEYMFLYNYFSTLHHNYRSFQRNVLKYCISVTHLSFSTSLFPKDIFLPVKFNSSIGPFPASTPQELATLQVKRHDITMGIKRAEKAAALAGNVVEMGKKKCKNKCKIDKYAEFDPFAPAAKPNKKGSKVADKDSPDQAQTANSAATERENQLKQYAPFYDYLNHLPIESKLHFYQPILSDLGIYTAPLCLPYILSLFPNVTHLTLDNCVPRNEDDLLTLFDYFPQNLTSLTLVNIDFDACWTDFSRTLATLPVSHLIFDHCGLNDDAIKSLTPILGQLIELSISSSRQLTDRSLAVMLQAGIDILRFHKCNQFTGAPFAQLAFSSSNANAAAKKSKSRDHIGIDYYPPIAKHQQLSDKGSNNHSKDSTSVILDSNGVSKLHKRGYLHTLDISSCAELNYFCYASTILQNLILTKLPIKSIYLITTNLRFADFSENLPLKRISLFAPLLQTLVMKNNPVLRSFTSNILPSFSPRDVILPILTQNIYSTVSQTIKSESNPVRQSNGENNTAEKLIEYDGKMKMADFDAQEVTAFASTTTSDNGSDSNNMLDSKYFLPSKYNALQLNPTSWSVPAIFDLSKSILQSSVLYPSIHGPQSSTKSFVIGREIMDDIPSNINSIPSNTVFSICTSSSSYLNKPRCYNVLTHEKYRSLTNANRAYQTASVADTTSSNSNNKKDPKDSSEQAFNTMLSILNNEKNNLSAFITPKMQGGGSYFRARVEGQNNHILQQSFTEVQYLDEENGYIEDDDDYDDGNVVHTRGRYDPNAHLTSQSIHLATGGTGFYRRSNLHQTHTAHYIAVPKHKETLFELIAQARVLIPSIYALTIKSLTNAIAVWYNYIVNYEDKDSKKLLQNSKLLRLLPHICQEDKPSIYNYYNNPLTRTRMNNRATHMFDQLDDQDYDSRVVDDGAMDFDDLDEFISPDDNFGLFDIGPQPDAEFDYYEVFKSLVSSKPALVVLDVPEELRESDEQPSLRAEFPSEPQYAPIAAKGLTKSNVPMKLSDYLDQCTTSIVDCFLPSLQYLDITGSHKISIRHVQHFINCNNHLNRFFFQTPTTALNSSSTAPPLIVVGFEPFFIPHTSTPTQNIGRSIYPQHQPITQCQFVKGHFVLVPPQPIKLPTQQLVSNQSLLKIQQQQQQNAAKSTLKPPSTTEPLTPTPLTILPSMQSTPSIATSLQSLDGRKPIIRQHPKSQLQLSAAQKILPPLSIASRITINASNYNTNISHDFLTYKSLFLEDYLDKSE